MTGRTTASKYSRSRFLMKKWSSWQLYSDRCLSFWSRVRLLQLLTKLSFAHVEHVLLLVFWISLRISLTFYRSSISLTSEDVMSSMKSDWSLKRQILVRDSVSPLLSSSAFLASSLLMGTGHRLLLLAIGSAERQIPCLRRQPECWRSSLVCHFCTKSHHFRWVWC